MAAKKKSKSGPTVGGVRNPDPKTPENPVPEASGLTALSVDVVVLRIIGGQLSVLLIRRGEKPHRGRWALPGEALETGERLVSAARRAVAVAGGSTGLPNHLEQLAAFDHPDRYPKRRVLSFAFVALMAGIDESADGLLGEGTRWWPIGDLEGVDRPELAFDHRSIVDAGVERVRSKLEYTSLATRCVDEPFTIGDLRQVYEAVWGFPQPAANFRRKVLTTPGFVEATGRSAAVSIGRPAELYVRGDIALLHPAMLRPSGDRRR